MSGSTYAARMRLAVAAVESVTDGLQYWWGEEDAAERLGALCEDAVGSHFDMTIGDAVGEEPSDAAGNMYTTSDVEEVSPRAAGNVYIAGVDQSLFLETILHEGEAEEQGAEELHRVYLCAPSWWDRVAASESDLAV